MSAALLWFIAGFVLVLSEFALPGIILVFIGLGAWVASLAAWAGWADTVAAQMTVFAASSLILLLGLRRWFKAWFLGSSHNAATAGAVEDFIGRSVRVVTALRPPHQGKVEFKGAQWNALSTESMEPGDTAVIVSVDGLCLKVKRQLEN